MSSRLDKSLETREEWKAQAINYGWVKIPQVTEIRNTDPDSSWGLNDKGLTVNGERVMTGQEWYDRLMEELNSVGVISWSSRTKDQILAAARRASGIS